VTGLIDGQVAVITGAAHGIGAATSELFAEHGAAAVYVTDVDGDGAAAVADRIGPTAVALTVDVVDPGALLGLRDRVLADHGRVDVLVNNAGHYLTPYSLDEGTDEHWQGLYQVNFLHVVRATKLFLEPMLAQGSGAIVNVSSIEGVRGYPVDPVYGALKAAVVQFTRCVGVDVAGRGVRVNGIAPDLTDTVQSNFSEWDRPEVAERWENYLPLGRMGEPVDQARTVLYLASELASFVVGQTINTDGGTAEAAGWYRSDRRPGRRWTNRPFDP
jgi:NAD(P)-dependent dehydrogenase (short-subunit alcohol dehydrogenase family)